MLTRRRFVHTVAAAAAFGRLSGLRAAAATHDLIIKGGRVIDPSLRVDAVADVAIAGGRIAAVGAGITADSAQTLDARGKIVVPGLIDIHSHFGRSSEGPDICLADGATGFIDAGSQGADH